MQIDVVVDFVDDVAAFRFQAVAVCVEIAIVDDVDHVGSGFDFDNFVDLPKNVAESLKLSHPKYWTISLIAPQRL